MTDNVSTLTIGQINNNVDTANADDIQLLVNTAVRAGIENTDQLAYVLATAKHESAGFGSLTELCYCDDPVEYFSNQYNGIIGNIPDTDDGYTYRGRGYVQLTGRANYEKFSDVVGRDLVSQPELAGQAETAAQILVEGMQSGAFRGNFALDDFINNEETDFINARRIVNSGQDRAELIASYANEYAESLEDSFSIAATLDVVEDFIVGTTTDGVLEYEIERTGDLSFPVEIEFDGTVVEPAGIPYEDASFTYPAGGAILEAATNLNSFAGFAEDILIEVKHSATAAGEAGGTKTAEFEQDTVQLLFVGDGVDDLGGLAFGDPHLTTFDNVAYDFQAAGDFVLARATEGPEYEVQARFTALSSAVSATTAMATSVDGTTVSVESDGDDGVLRIGGTVTELADGESVSVGPGTVSRSGERIEIDHGNGDETSVDVFDTFLNVVPSPSLARTPGSGEGLLGNADGDPGNEFQLSDGTVLSTPVPVETLYGEYAQDWQVDEGNSLLPGPAEPFDAPDRIVTLDSLPDNVRGAAEEAVASANIENEVVREAAILDFALTGNQEFIDAAAQVDESFDPIVDTVPVDPVNDPAIVLTTDRTTLNEEDAAARTATFTVSRGSTDGDLTVNYTSAGVGDAPADVSDFAADSGSGQVLIEDGQESASFEVKIADDTLDEGTEAFNTSISLEEDQAPDYEVLISSVRTTIEDADEGMALNEVRGTDGRDNLRGTDGPDQMISLAGSYDRMAGSGGADEFIFGAEATNGVRERDVISNFDVAEDSIVLRDGASVADSRERDDTVVLSLDDGNDVAYIRGDGVSLDTVNIVDENLLV